MGADLTHAQIQVPLGGGIFCSNPLHRQEGWGFLSFRVFLAKKKLFQQTIFFYLPTPHPYPGGKGIALTGA